MSELNGRTDSPRAIYKTPKHPLTSLHNTLAITTKYYIQNSSNFKYKYANTNGTAHTLNVPHRKYTLSYLQKLWYNEILHFLTKYWTETFKTQLTVKTINSNWNLLLKCIWLIKQHLTCLPLKVIIKKQFCFNNVMHYVNWRQTICLFPTRAWPGLNTGFLDCIWNRFCKWNFRVEFLYIY